MDWKRSPSYLNGMVDELLSRRPSVNLVALVQVFQQLRGRCFGDAVLEIRADIGGAVWAVLLAQAAEDQRGGLLWSELRFLFVFLGRRHCADVGRCGISLMEGWSGRLKYCARNATGWFLPDEADFKVHATSSWLPGRSRGRRDGRTFHLFLAGYNAAYKYTGSS